MRRTRIAETLYRAFELAAAGKLNALRSLIREEGIPELRAHMRSQAFHGAIAGRQLAVLRFTLDEPCERGLVDEYLGPNQANPESGFSLSP